MNMEAMILEKICSPLQLTELPIPQPAPEELLIKVRACGVCRTDLHVYDGDLKEPKLPLVLGHEIVGTVVQLGKTAKHFSVGQRVGIPWLGKSCGTCLYCQRSSENLCDDAKFTGYQIDGGYAEYTVADSRFCFPIPEKYSDAEAAPLLCAGLIGYRAYRMANKGERIGLYGFGAAAHIIIQIARYEGRKVYVFTRPNDKEGQEFARRLGAVWTGGSDKLPPEPLDSVIIFAPVGALVPAALGAVVKGGIVVCAGIHMSDIPSFPYHLLWGEKVVRSVANLTRRDGIEFFEIAQRVPVKIHVQPFKLTHANEALEYLRSGQIQGAAVLVIEN
jgi:propanol-preferring alcohol dehydrogenase